jgi:hypothetical protein
MLRPLAVLQGDRAAGEGDDLVRQVPDEGDPMTFGELREGVADRSGVGPGEVGGRGRRDG